MIEIRKPGISDLTDSRAGYEEIYQEQGIRLLDSFYLWILSLLPVKPGMRLLDVSCGEGSLLTFAQKLGAIANGLDISYYAAQVASQRTGGGRVAVGDGEALPFPDGYFDLVTNIGSLEHYLHPEAGMRELARVLKPTGKACILLPNSFGLFLNIYWVLKTGEVYIDDQPIQRYATRRRWKEMLEESGLQVVSVRKYNWPLPRTVGDLYWYLKRPRKLLATLLATGIPTNLASCQVFICVRSRPEPDRIISENNHETRVVTRES